MTIEKNLPQDPPAIAWARPKKERKGITHQRAKDATLRKVAKIEDVDWKETEQGKVIHEYIDGVSRKGPPKKGERMKPVSEEMTYERRAILVGLEVLRDPSQGARSISRITGLPRETIRDIMRRENFKIDMATVISKLGQRVLENAIEANDLLNDIFMNEQASVFLDAKDLCAIADKNIRLYSYMKGENVNPDGTEKEFQFRFADNLLEAGLKARPKKDAPEPEESDENDG